MHQQIKRRIAELRRLVTLITCALPLLWLCALDVAQSMATPLARGALHSTGSHQAQLRVQLGHAGRVRGALELHDGRILSWSDDGTLRTWAADSGRALAVWTGHGSTVYGAAPLSGGRVVSWSADGTLRIWEDTTGETLSVLEGHESIVHGGYVLESGDVLSWSFDGTVRRWDGGTGRLLHVMRHEGLLQRAFPLSDGRVLSWSDDHSLRIWDADTGALQTSMIGHTGRIWGASELRGQRVLSWSEDGTARIWSARTGEQEVVFRGHEGDVEGAVELDTSRILTWSRDGNFRAWESASGTEIGTLVAHRGAVLRARVLRDGRVLSCGEDQDLYVWNTHTTRPEAALRGHSYPWGYANGNLLDAIELDDGRILSWSSDHTLRVWNPQSGDPLAVMEGHDAVITGVRVLSDGGVLSWAADGELRVWDTWTGALRAALIGGSKPVESITDLGNAGFISTSSDGRATAWKRDSGRTIGILESEDGRPPRVEVMPDRRVLVGEFVGPWRVWDTTTGRMAYSLDALNAIPLPDGRILTWDEFSDDGQLETWEIGGDHPAGRLEGHTAAVRGARVLGVDILLTWSEDGTFRTWDLPSGRCKTVIQGYSGYASNVVPLNDGILLSWNSDDGVVQTWDLTHGEPISRIDDRWMGDWNRFFANGRILSGSGDDTLTLWDGRTGARIATLEGETPASADAELCSDDRILTWDVLNEVKLWDASNGSNISVMRGHTRAVRGAKLLDDGRVVSWSVDGTLRIYDGDTGRARSALLGHVGPINGVHVLPEGVLLSWSDDGTQRLWDYVTGKALATVVHTADADWAVVSPDGRFDASPDFKGLHFVVGGTDVIALEQLHDRFYEPDLLAKILGWSDEPLREIEGLDEVGLWPDVDLPPPRKGTANVVIDLADRGGGIGEVRVRLNGAEVVADARTTRGNHVPVGAKKATLKIDLTAHPKLRPGEENEVEVIAFNGDGSIASRGAVCRFVSPGVASAERPDLHALVVGVSDYSGEELDLAYAAKDAADFAAAVEIAARAGGLFEDVSVGLLSSSSRDAQPTRQNLEQAFADMQATKPSDVVVVFLAGHGVQSPTVEDSYLFLTQDATSTSGLADPELQARWAISSQEIHEWLTQVPAGKQVLILDTCAAGAASESLASERKLSGSQIRAIDRLNRATGMHVLMGSAADAASYEASRYGQGLLTYALLEGMRGAGLDEGGYVDVRTLFDHAQGRVGDLARSIGGVQEPEIRVPKGDSFAIGQLGEDERRMIPLEQTRPMISRPSFQNRDEAEDDLDLTDHVAAALAERMYAGPRGTEPLVFVDARDVAGGCRPTGNYTVGSGRIDLRLKLKRDGETILDIELTSMDTDLDRLVTRIVESVVAACPTD